MDLDRIAVALALTRFMLNLPYSSCHNFFLSYYNLNYDALFIFIWTFLGYPV